MGNEGSWVDFPIPGGSDAKVGSRRYLPFTVASAKVSFPPRSYGNGGAVWHRRRHAKMMKVSHGPGE